MILNSFAIYTLGCKVNIYESNSIRNQLILNGLIEKPFNSFADIYIVNTCSVTKKADSKSINIIRRAKKNNPNAILIAAGCFTQMNTSIQNELDIDIMIGNKYKNNIYDLILTFLKKKERIQKIENLFLNPIFEENENINFTNQTRAFLKIQDGCNFMCSYCIIPFSRGRQRSKKMNLVLNEIKSLSKNFKEIVLTGVNIAGYNDGENNFEKLLNEIKKIKGNFRIRISSVEPFQINDNIIKIVTNNKDRFCQQWHICLQSASNKVLNDMNRKYSIEEYYDLICKIRKKSPLSTFTTDYIVGFPTETNEDHINSIEWIKKIKFLDIHIFPFSKRKNTSANKYKDISSSIIKERVLELTKLNESLKKEVINDFVNKETFVIFEKSNLNNYQSGFSSEYLKVIVKTNKDLSGEIHKVIILRNSLNGVLGEII